MCVEFYRAVTGMHSIVRAGSWRLKMRAVEVLLTVLVVDISV